MDEMDGRDGRDTRDTRDTILMATFFLSFGFWVENTRP